MVLSACVCLALLSTSSALVVQRGLQAPMQESTSSGLNAETKWIKDMNEEKELTHRCDESPKKTLAMIISGLEPRLLLQSKLKNVVEPLAAAGVSVDLYIDVVASSAGDGKQFTPVPGSRQSSDLAALQEELPKFLTRNCGSLQFVNIRADREPMDVPPQEMPAKWKRARNGGYKRETIRNVYRRYSSYQFLMEQIASNERKRGNTYDFVLVTRDDDDWLGPLQFADILELHDASNSMFSKDCKTWKGVNDMTLLFGRKAADKILGRMFSAFMNSSIYDMSRTRNAEQALKVFAEWSNVTKHPLPFHDIPTVCGVYVPSDTWPGDLEVCHKTKALCEKKGWNLNLCADNAARLQKIDEEEEAEEDEDERQQ